MGDRDWMHEPSVERRSDRAARSFGRSRLLGDDRLFARLLGGVIVLGIVIVVVAVALN